jgi:DNA-binding beta-propeller fold protein YncE
MNTDTNLRTRFAPVLAAALALGLSGCLSEDELMEKAPDKAYVIATTSDYKTGNYSLFGLDSAFTRTNVDPIHSDATVRYHGGDDIIIINRLKRDNLQIVDKHNLKTVLPITLPALSNPYDAEVRDGKIYVAMIAYDSILVFNQKDGSRFGAISVHAYADADGFAEATALKFVGGALYAILGNLDTKTYTPLPRPKLLKIDVKALKVEKALDLPFSNPAGITWDKDGGKLYIPCVGEYTESDFFTPKLDGGIAVIDLAAFTASELIGEKDLGGNVGSALFHSGKLIFTLGVAGADKVTALTVAAKAVTTIATLGAFAGGGLALDAQTNTLCVGDRGKGKGLRLFDLDTFKERTASNIDLGLPPSSLAIIR